MKCISEMKQSELYIMCTARDQWSIIQYHTIIIYSLQNKNEIQN